MSTALAIDLQDYTRRELAERVATTVENVRRRGDQALRSVGSEPLRLSAAELERSLAAVPATTLEDLGIAQEQTRRLMVAQRTALADRECEGPGGIRVGTRHVPAACAGICVPEPGGTGDAGRAELFAAQSGAIAARVAGVEHVIACVPGRAGMPDPVIVAALVLAGVQEIYRCGGARALAAMRLGTDSIPRVDTVHAAADPELEEADQLLEATAAAGQGGRGLLVIADDAADPELAAADLIAAGECGPGARGVLIATSPSLGARVASAVERQLGALPDADGLHAAWRLRGAIHVVGDGEAACALADRHVFARVEVLAAHPRWYLERLRRCSVVLLGPAAGLGLADIAARRPAATVWATSANAVAGLTRPIAYREADHCVDGVAVARLRRLTGLEAHARACELRALRAPAARPHQATRTPATAIG